MSNAKWIWSYGDFELYHNMLLSNRRCDKDFLNYPCMWKVSRPEYNVRFYKRMKAEKDTVVRVVTHSSGIVFFRGLDGGFPVNEDIHVPAGEYRVVIKLQDLESFPAMFIDGEYLKTDESWVCDSNTCFSRPVGCNEYFTSADQDPKMFPFLYETLQPVSCEEIDGGILYDFGKETFGPVTIEQADSDDEIVLIYGDSRPEALSYKHAVNRETLKGSYDSKRPTRAFRYLYVKSKKGNPVSIKAEYEYLPLVDRASFSCDDELIAKIWDVCAYTFHLNSREGFFDGIKRDRWIWGGDAYQSFMVDWYLFFDEDIVRRTIISLLGKLPCEVHVNGSNDYSAYIIIAMVDYYMATGDVKFLRNMWSNIKGLYEFMMSRLDEKGYVVQRGGDWIFVDWSQMEFGDKMLCEQILLWKAHLSMGELALLCGEEDIYSKRASVLKEQIERDFWNEEKKAYVDTIYNEDKAHVSRQPNIFAILYDFTDESKAKEILEHVLKNDEVTPITTPYFKLFELMAFGKMGAMEEAQKYIRSYWGGMIELGATTIWEQFDPKEQGDEHYVMYDSPFGRSLCHAWGSGPILIFGKYICGVTPTAPGYESFLVKPCPGIYKTFEGKVPLPKGEVTVVYDHGTVTVTATAPGGVLEFAGKRVELPVGETVTLGA